MCTVRVALFGFVDISPILSPTTCKGRNSKNPKVEAAPVEEAWPWVKPNNFHVSFPEIYAQELGKYGKHDWNLMVVAESTYGSVRKQNNNIGYFCYDHSYRNVGEGAP